MPYVSVAHPFRTSQAHPRPCSIPVTADVRSPCAIGRPSNHGQLNKSKPSNLAIHVNLVFWAAISSSGGSDVKTRHHDIDGCVGCAGEPESADDGGGAGIEVRCVRGRRCREYDSPQVGGRSDNLIHSCTPCNHYIQHGIYDFVIMQT